MPTWVTTTNGALGSGCVYLFRHACYSLFTKPEHTRIADSIIGAKNNQINYITNQLFHNTYYAPI
ncbi:hypothetical protein [Weissella paramesenteroides]|uniref:hypothetical protein n=1 Tax=Weissella paramesenteroides TaxID=1249 RepID=UPI00223B1D3B|nr:hypothetical protein [Weissella paramesenteroides]